MRPSRRAPRTQSPFVPPASRPCMAVYGVQASVQCPEYAMGTRWCFAFDRERTSSRDRRARSSSWKTRSADEQGAQGALGDLEADLDLVLGAAPDWILVLDREHAVEAALVEGV